MVSEAICKRGVNNTEEEHKITVQDAGSEVANLCLFSKLREQDVTQRPILESRRLISKLKC
jgi:hypothetical protein